MTVDFSEATAACGLSLSLSSVADAATDSDAVMTADVAMTAVCGSSFFSSSAADAAMDLAAAS